MSGLTVVMLACLPWAGPSPFAYAEVDGTGLELTEGGRRVFVYNYGQILANGTAENRRRGCYLAPVCTPAGTVITDDFNPDHPHHRGISWMWQDITVGGKKGDIWTLAGFQLKHVAWLARETGDKTALLSVENGWYDGDKRFVKETVAITVHAAEGPQRVMDFVITEEALDEPVTIVGTAEGKKGFGGFCFRFAPRDGGAAKTVITTDQGVQKDDGVLAQAAWAQVTGTFKGRPAGGRIDDDPTNPGYPKTGWLLRHGFGFLNPSWPALTPTVLEKGKPVTLKYRVTVWDGEVAPQ
ncbi:MAG: PmoA family protein [Armatimonadetes bacterium]|nr:PmoA family protein [Armatimonadota bacterium]